ncbi:MAG: PQQ-dependent sugar dehydrogenase [Flavobacteriales bacterium]|nr:PQQ-dependent sugar dehydrogenase [Flavobacteriales bacterium]
MKTSILFVSFCIFNFPIHHLLAQNPTPPDVDLTEFVSGYLQPCGIYNAGDHRLFILEKDQGDIEIVDTSGVAIGKFLDVSGVLSSGGERGLLGLAFHPNYADNGFFYINYTNTSFNTVVARYTVSANPNVANPLSATIIITIPQDFSNHNGGHLAFGPDGYLYIGMGDGGSGGDPNNRAQDPLQLLGKMLRIDVDNGTLYAIPPTNPFFGQTDTLPEIWALGMRNPWKFSFDDLTGDLWIGDVGQNVWEEIDFEPAGSPGGSNYGWRCYEGNASFNLSGCNGINNYDFPVADYNHGGQDDYCSITGGIVYRGSTYPGMYGYYFLTDYCEGGIRTLFPNGIGGFSEDVADPGLGFGGVAFGISSSGELYLVSIGGTIYKVEDECGSFSPVLSSDGNGSLTATSGGLQYWWWNEGAMVATTGSVNSYSPNANGTWYATVNNGSCTRKSNELEWLITEGIPGCTYMVAFNYNPVADVDDGSCDFGIPGCTDQSANNYNPAANTDDGSCLFGTPGCLESNACNYNAAATYNDCTLCDFESCFGCTQTCALNYDPLATHDDGTCEGCIECPGDLNNDGIINVSDLLIFMAAFGTACNE